jgi:hypothetical protein
VRRVILIEYLAKEPVSYHELGLRRRRNHGHKSQQRVGYVLILLLGVLPIGGPPGLEHRHELLGQWFGRQTFLGHSHEILRAADRRVAQLQLGNHDAALFVAILATHLLSFSLIFVKVGGIKRRAISI